MVDYLPSSNVPDPLVSLGGLENCANLLPEEWVSGVGKRGAELGAEDNNFLPFLVSSAQLEYICILQEVKHRSMHRSACRCGF